MLDKKIQSELKSIIFQYLDPKHDRVFVFGSRASKKSRKYSDIDIGITSENRIKARTLGI